MGLFDSIAGAVGNAIGGGNQSGEGAQTILSNLLQQGGTGQRGNIVGSLLGGLGGAQGGAQGGGMASTLETLASSGLGAEVSSWMSNGHNLPISPQQLHDALGSEQVQQMAQASGLPIGEFLKHLADHLPAAAAQASGTQPPD